ncbi:MAG: hypothetical protein PHE58_04125, partial [Candidatus Omnitrophica bacterium]|nr:hypothetical protein [Candidatus Omnitrophota bacterium]
MSGEFKGMQIADKAIAVTRESITGPFDASLSDVRAALIDKGISTDPNRMLHYEFKDDQYSYYRLEETIPMTFSEWPFAGLTGSIHKDTNFRDKTLTLDYNVNNYLGKYNLNFGTFVYGLGENAVDPEKGADMNQLGSYKYDQEKSTGRLTISSDQFTAYVDKQMKVHFDVQGLGEVTVNSMNQVSNENYAYMPKLTLQGHPDDKDFPTGGLTWTGSALLDYTHKEGQTGYRTYFNIQSNGWANYGQTNYHGGDEREGNHFDPTGTGYISDEASTLISLYSSITGQADEVTSILPFVYGVNYATLGVDWGMHDGDHKGYVSSKPITGGPDVWWGTNKHTGAYIGGFPTPEDSLFKQFASDNSAYLSNTIFFLTPYSGKEFANGSTPENMVSAAQRNGLSVVYADANGAWKQNNPLFMFITNTQPQSVISEQSLYSVEGTYQIGQVYTKGVDLGAKVWFDDGKGSGQWITGDVDLAKAEFVKTGDKTYRFSPDRQSQVEESPSSTASLNTVNGVMTGSIANVLGAAMPSTSVSPEVVAREEDKYNVIQASFNPMNAVTGLYTWAKNTEAGKWITSQVYKEDTTTYSHIEDGGTTTITKGTLLGFIPYSESTTITDPATQVTQTTTSKAFGFEKTSSYTNANEKMQISATDYQSFWGGYRQEAVSRNDQLPDYQITSVGAGPIRVGTGTYDGQTGIYQSTLNGETFTTTEGPTQKVTFDRGTFTDGGRYQKETVTKPGSNDPVSVYYQTEKGMTTDITYLDKISPVSGIKLSFGTADNKQHELNPTNSADILKITQVGAQVTTSKGNELIEVRNNNYIQPYGAATVMDAETTVKGVTTEKKQISSIYTELGYDPQRITPITGVKTETVTYEVSANPLVKGSTVSESAYFAKTAFDPDDRVLSETLTTVQHTETKDNQVTASWTAEKVMNNYEYPDQNTVVNNYENVNVEDAIHNTLSNTKGTSIQEFDTNQRLAKYEVHTESEKVQDLSVSTKPVIFEGRRDVINDYSYAGSSLDPYQHSYDNTEYNYLTGQAEQKKGAEVYNAYNEAGQASDIDTTETDKIWGLTKDNTIDQNNLKLHTESQTSESDITWDGYSRSSDYESWAATFVNQAKPDTENTVTHISGGEKTTTVDIYGLAREVTDSGLTETFKIAQSSDVAAAFNKGDVTGGWEMLTVSSSGYQGELIDQKQFEDKQTGITYDNLDRMTGYKFENKITDNLSAKNSGVVTGEWQGTYSYKDLGTTVDGAPRVQTILSERLTTSGKVETSQSVYNGYDFSAMASPIQISTEMPSEARILSYEYVQAPSVQAVAAGWVWNNAIVPAAAAINDYVVTPLASAYDYVAGHVQDKVSSITSWGSEPQQTMVFGGDSVHFETTETPSNWDKAWSWWVDNAGNGNPYRAEQAAIGTGLVLTAPVAIYAGTTATGSAIVSYAAPIVSRELAKRIIVDAAIGHAGILTGKEAYSLMTDGKLYTPGLNDFGYDLSNPDRIEGIVVPFALNVAAGELLRGPVDAVLGKPVLAVTGMDVFGVAKVADTTISAANTVKGLRVVTNGIKTAAMQLPKDILVGGTVFMGADNIAHIATEGTYMNLKDTLSSFGSGAVLASEVRIATTLLGTALKIAGYEPTLQKFAQDISRAAERDDKWFNLNAWVNNAGKKAVLFGIEQPKLMPIDFKTVRNFVTTGWVYTGFNALMFNTGEVRSKLVDLVKNGTGSLKDIFTAQTISYQDNAGNQKNMNFLQYVAVDTANFAKMGVYLPALLGIAGAPHTVTSNKAIQAFSTNHSFSNLFKVMSTAFKGGSMQDLVISNLAKREAAGFAATGFAINNFENAAFVATTLGVNNKVFYTAFKALGAPEQTAQALAGQASFISLFFMPSYTGTKIDAQSRKATTDLLTSEGYSDIKVKATSDALTYRITAKNSLEMPVEFEGRLSISSEKDGNPVAILFPKTGSEGTGIRVFSLDKGT